MHHRGSDEALHARGVSGRVPPQEEKPADEVPPATTKKRRARRPRIEFPQYLEHRRTEYVLNRWAAFVRYTEDGRIPIDNNVIERLLRPVAIGRKNYLIFGSEKGGKTRQSYTRWCRVQGATALTCGRTLPTCCVGLRPSPLATRLPWRPCCRIAGWLPTPSIAWSSGRKNPAKPKPDEDASGPHVGLPSPSRSC